MTKSHCHQNAQKGILVRKGEVFLGQNAAGGILQSGKAQPRYFIDPAATLFEA